MSTYWIRLLDNDPIQFYQELVLYYKNEPDIIRDTLNVRLYDIWYGNIVHALTYLVGDREKVEIERHDFYGSKSAISNKLGIKILYLLSIVGVNFSVLDYYSNTPYKHRFDKLAITYRTNNEEYYHILNKLTHDYIQQRFISIYIKTIVYNSLQKYIPHELIISILQLYQPK